VWPWNAAVAVAAPLLFLSQERRAAFPNKAVVAVAGVFFVFPALYYFDAMDAYVSHNLYSTSIATAKICDDGSERCSTDEFDTWDSLNVPLPPEPRLYRQTFDKVCKPGDELVVTGIRTFITGKPTQDRQGCPSA
jgi:hypothetical protein